MLIFSSPPSLLFLGLEDVTKNVVSNVQNVLTEKKFLSLKHDINWNKITLHGLLTFPSAPRRLQNTSEEPRRRQKVVKKFVACLVPIVKVEEGVHLIQDYQ